MKNVFLKWTMVFLLTLTTLSCSDDDTTEAPTIDGVWEFSKLGYTDGNGTLLQSSVYVHGCANQKDNWKFLPNQILETQEFSDCDTDYTSNYTISLQDGILQITSNGEVTNVYRILELTATQLKIVEQATNIINRGGGYSYYEFVKR